MKRTAATLLGVAALAAVPASAHGDAVSILSAVNTERELAGIDPLTARKDWTSSCAQHTNYMATNNVLTHYQTAGSPLFSADGAWAGSHSVLARSTAGFYGNPWSSAPLHEFQVLHPWLRETGVAVNGSYACMVTLGTRDAPNPPDTHLVTSPGFGQYHRPAEVAKESPFTPGDELGLPQGTKTGPHIYVYAVGPTRFPKLTIQSATLTASDTGAETGLMWVDGASARSGAYLDGGAILVPAGPLREGVSYGLRVQASGTTTAGQLMQISRTTSFITGPDESELRPVNDTNDTGKAASATPVLKSTGKKKNKGTLITRADGTQMLVTLAWTQRGRGVRARIVCLSTAERCTGPVRILAKKRGQKTQKLRFKAGPGALKLKLAPGKSIVRKVKLTKGQRHNAHKRGFAVRWGGGAPIKLAKPRG